MSTLWRIAGMLALATGLIMLINSCSVDSAAASLRATDQTLTVGLATPEQSQASSISHPWPIRQGGAGSAFAGLQPNFDARPLQLKDGTSLEVEILVTG